MIPGVDHIIESLLKTILHRQREKHINRFFDAYAKEHPLNDEQSQELLKKLNTEIDRIYAIVDRSVLRERIQRARYTFWVTAIIGTAITVALASFPVTTSIVPFFVPVMAAFGAWLIAVVTIPIGYNQRIKGGLDSVLLQFEPSPNDTSQKDENKINHELVIALQTNIRELNGKMASMENEIYSLKLKHDAEPIKMADNAMTFWQAKSEDEKSLIPLDEHPQQHLLVG